MKNKKEEWKNTLLVKNQYLHNNLLIIKNSDKILITI